MMAPVEVFADIGINHNGDVQQAIALAEVAKAAKCTAVKLQVRTPNIVVPPEHRTRQYPTPWGVVMPYLEYRQRIELSADAIEEFNAACGRIGIDWFASAWDMESWARLRSFEHQRVKIASAMLGYRPLLLAAKESGAHIYLSTGMHTLDEIDQAVEFLKDAKDRLTLLHCNSAYPADNADINLNMIGVLRDRYGVRVGYSGHERGLQISYAAVALGAVVIERHITMDRTQVGSDHAASIEPSGLMRFVRDIRAIEQAMGGIKTLTAAELKVRDKLRWYRDTGV